MPAKLDLTGQPFGKLTVVAPVERIGGRTAWRCRCECGATVDVATMDLTSVRRTLACPDCGGPKPRPARSKRCQYCGVEFLGHGRALFCSQECRLARRRGLLAGTDFAGPVIEPCVICGHEIRRTRGRPGVCSAECRREHRRRKAIESWNRRLARDPELSKKMGRRLRARAQVDPKVADRIKRWDKAKYETHRRRMKDDPEYAAIHRQRCALHWIRNRERIMAKRQARLDAMNPIELGKWLERARISTRNHQRRKRAGMTPEQQSQARDKQREYHRQKQRMVNFLEAQRLQEEFDAREQRISNGRSPVSEPT